MLKAVVNISYWISVVANAKIRMGRDKTASNIKNHGIDFEEAKPVFEDLNALDVLDGRFDYGEERWVIIGRGAGGLLAVVYVERDGVNRIISARLTTKKETDEYVVQKDAWN